MAISQPLRYLDKALNGLRDLNLVPEKTDEAPIIDLIEQISDLDQEKTLAIARTLSQASLFNEVVREQVRSMELGQRYEQITGAFNSIRDDARNMVKQVEDGKIDTFERIGNVWMKVTRGDIPARFADIKKTYLDVTRDSDDQIRRERTILDAYLDFRGALKESEVLALEVLKTAEARTRRCRRSRLTAATTSPSAPGSNSPATRRCARCSTTTAATRSPRTSPTTSR